MILSICMMVKNEERNLKRCLESLDEIRQAVHSELIIVDTGSTDDTANIARQFTDNVFYHEWNNNFSDMRNKTISYAKGKWILIIDADEELYDSSGLIDFIQKDISSFTGAAIKLENIVDQTGRRGSVITTVRLFRNDGEFRYIGTVHNLPVIKGEVMEVEGKILHYGYMVDDLELMDKKFERTSKLLIEELKKNPDSIYYRFQLATTYDMHRDYDLAKIEYERAYKKIELLGLDKKEYLYLWGPLVKIYLGAGEFYKAIELAEEGLDAQNYYLDLHYFLGMAYMGLSEYEKGIESLNQYLEILKIIQDHPISKNPALQLYTLKTEDECRFNLLQANMKLEKWEEVSHNALWLMENTKQDTNFFIVGLTMFIKASVVMRKVEELISLYNIYPQSKWIRLDEILIANIDELSIDVSDERAYLFELSALPTILGSILRLRLELATDGELLNTNLYGNGNDYYDLICFNYSEALMIAIQKSINLSNLIETLDETNCMSLLAKLDTKYKDFPEYLSDYLDNIVLDYSYASLKLRRLFCKYLMIKEFGSTNSVDSVSRYIEVGIKCMEFKYTEEYLKTSSMSLYANSEEQALNIIWKVINNCSSNRVELIQKVFIIFPEWREPLLRWFESYFGCDVNSKKIIADYTELLFLKEELLKNIDYLLENNLFDEAGSILKEYSSTFELDEITKMKYSHILYKTDSQKN